MACMTDSSRVVRAPITVPSPRLTIHHLFGVQQNTHTAVPMHFLYCIVAGFTKDLVQPEKANFFTSSSWVFDDSETVVTQVVPQTDVEAP